MAWPKNPKAPSKTEAEQMKSDMLKADGAYYNIKRTFSAADQQAAVEKVNKLTEIINGRRVWLD